MRRAIEAERARMSAAVISSLIQRAAAWRARVGEFFGRGGGGDWALRSGDLPGPRTLRLEPRLQGLEENAYFRLLCHRRRAMKRRRKRSREPRVEPDLRTTPIKPADEAIALVGIEVGRSRERRRIWGTILLLALVWEEALRTWSIPGWMVAWAANGLGGFTLGCARFLPFVEIAKCELSMRSARRELLIQHDSALLAKWAIRIIARAVIGVLILCGVNWVGVKLKILPIRPNLFAYPLDVGVACAMGICSALAGCFFGIWAKLRVRQEFDRLVDHIDAIAEIQQKIEDQPRPDWERELEAGLRETERKPRRHGRATI